MLTSLEFIILLRCENDEIGNELWNYIYAQKRYWVHLKKVGYLVFVKAEEKDNVFNIFHLPAL